MPKLGPLFPGIHCRRRLLARSFLRSRVRLNSLRVKGPFPRLTRLNGPRDPMGRGSPKAPSFSLLRFHDVPRLITRVFERASPWKQCSTVEQEGWSILKLFIFPFLGELPGEHRPGRRLHRAPGHHHRRAAGDAHRAHHHSDSQRGEEQQRPPLPLENGLDDLLRRGRDARGARSDFLHQSERGNGSRRPIEGKHRSGACVCEAQETSAVKAPE